MNFCFNIRCGCTFGAVIASLLVGIVTAVLQITGVAVLTVPFLWVAFGIAVGYLALLAASTAARQGCCAPLRTVLAGILGTVLFALVLLAVGITATSVLSAILAGLLLFFFSLTLTATACFVRCVSDCA